jgi:hypothetical protein
LGFECVWVWWVYLTPNPEASAAGFELVGGGRVLKEVVIGYGARAMWREPSTVWTEEQVNEIFRLKVVPMALSVSCWTWDSIFDLDSSLQVPEDAHWEQCIWRNLEIMKASLVGWEKEKEKPYWIAGFTKLTDDEEYIDLMHGVISPNELDPTWESLGYDVSEDVTISGLINMGYRPDERLFAVERFAPHLNEHHLFTDADIAMSFKQWSDTRDPGHGPFELYGLYLIEKHEG